MIAAVRARLQGLHPDSIAMVRGMVRVGVFVALTSILKMGKEVAIAFRYGASEQLDAYLFTFNIINWPLGVWLSILTVTLVPILAGGASNREKQLLGSEVVGVTLIMSCVAALLGYFVLPALLTSKFAGLSQSVSALAVSMAPGLMLLVPLGALAAVLSAWLLANTKHVNSLLEGVPALVLAIFVLLSPGSPASVLVGGVVAGYLLYVVSLGAAIRPRDWLVSPRFRQTSRKWSALWAGMSIMVIGQALMTSATLLDQFFAARLDEGSISILSYANRVLSLILVLGAVSISRGALPVFSKSSESERGLKIRAVHWSVVMLIVGAVVAAVAWATSPVVIRILFERGAFTTQDGLEVTQAFRYGTLQLPFYFSGVVLVAFLASRRRYVTLTIIGAINLMIKCGANFILLPAFGLNAMMLSAALMYLGSTVALYFAVLQTTRGKLNEGQ